MKMKLRFYPDPVLKQKAKKITTFDQSVRKLAQDMLDTMYEEDGVGLAAPQVGVSKQIMVIDVNAGDEDETRKPIVFINPVIIEREGEMVGQEGCLSFPGVFFEVKRARRIVVRYQNLAGKDLKLEAADNLLCRAIQHEIDHLTGELFIDKASSALQRDLEMTKNGFMEGDVDAMEAELKEEKGATIKLPQTQQEPVIG
ncbi:peptide deformylase [Candidatus Obscuribacterales bacterium]|nr:peptide deformylase [Candidatus Obscuribacterales bacterium]MBX3151750.1 peptide deformylase [Candidatus Obscuribacterales bacterium]